MVWVEVEKKTKKKVPVREVNVVPLVVRVLDAALDVLKETNNEHRPLKAERSHHQRVPRRLQQCMRRKRRKKQVRRG